MSIEPALTLVEFLRARLDEDERLAQSVETDLPLRAGEPYEDGSGIADDDEYPSYPWGHSSKAELPFMARWHPRTVLAEVAATRRIVDEHGPYVVDVAGRTDPTACGVCVDWDQADYDGAPPANAPCLTLRLLALPYAHHPDYSDRWRP